MTGPALVYDEQRVQRDGDFDLEFTGALLASSRHESVDKRWTEVDIFVSRGGQYVVATRFGGPSRPRVHYIAAVCVTPEDVLAWMKGPRAALGAAAKDALDLASRRYPDMFPLRPVIRID